MKRASASPLDAAVVSFLTLALAVQLLHLAVVAWRLSVDFWDGYEYSGRPRIAEAVPPLVAASPSTIVHGMLPPPSGTLLVAWIVLALVLVGLGTLVRRLGRVPAAAGTDPFLDFWTGWAALTVVLEAWHLVLPIDTGALAFVASLGLLGLATDGRRPWRALVRGARAHPFVVAAVLVAALWLSRLCLAGARNGDSGYYHFPIMRWAATFPAVPGLVNLFPFLAYNQSFLLYATVVNVGPLAQAGNHVANGILVLALLARCTLGLARAVQADASGAPADLYYALLLPRGLTIGAPRPRAGRSGTRGPRAATRPP